MAVAVRAGSRGRGGGANFDPHRNDSSTLPVTGMAQAISAAGTPAIQIDNTSPFSRHNAKPATPFLLPKLKLFIPNGRASTGVEVAGLLKIACSRPST